MEELNLDLLPEEAKKELYRLYKDLLKKYGVKTNTTTKDEIDKFFDQYNLDFSDFKFNREELYEK